MKIKEVTIGLTTSVKIAPYEYAKPEVSLTAIVEDGESYTEVVEDLKAKVSDELNKIVAVLQAEEQ